MFDKVEIVIDGLAREHPGKSGDEHEFCANFITSTFPQFVMRDFVKRTHFRATTRSEMQDQDKKPFRSLTNTRNLRATDPRDKIYGIQGFFGDPQSDRRIFFLLQIIARLQQTCMVMLLEQ